MAVTHTVTRTYKNQGPNALSLTEAPTADTEINLSKALSSGPNQEIDIAFTVANLQSVALSSTTACTVLTNSTSTPQDTIALAAGQVLIWTLATDGNGRIPFSGNVTKFYVTNAAATTFSINALVNQFV